MGCSSGIRGAGCDRVVRRCYQHCWGGNRVFVRVDSVTDDTINRPASQESLSTSMRRPLELSNSPATPAAPAKRVCGGEQRKRSDAVHALFLGSAWSCSASWFHKRL